MSRLRTCWTSSNSRPSVSLQPNPLDLAIRSPRYSTGAMSTAGTDLLDTASLQALLGPQLTEEQARLIYEQGPDAVVFALLSLAKQLAEKPVVVSTTPDPSTPSGQTPAYVKPTTKGRAKPKGAKPGHPGHRRPTPPRIDRRQEHTLSACPKCHGPVRACRSSRTRIIEDIP